MGIDVVYGNVPGNKGGLVSSKDGISGGDGVPLCGGIASEE